MTPRSRIGAAGLGRIGPWRVVRRLGRGGLASVYEVVAPASGERAALKLYADDGAARSLRREYRALAGLDHPGIVRVLGRGEFQGGAYLLTELVVGRTAQATARQAGAPGSPQRLAVTLRVIHDLLEALAYLHGRGIVHRDVKSSNVLADSTGHVKLLDMGTAGSGQASGGRRACWVPGLERFAGTVAYASPEQLEGKGLDGRSDLYAVGVLWYRMITGELPFPATGREQALLLRRQGPPLAPDLRVPDLSSRLGALVLSLLALEPGERPESADLVLAELRPMLVGSISRPASLWPEPPPIYDRADLLARIDAFVDDAGPAALRVLEGPPGAGIGPMLHWIGMQARRRGLRVFTVAGADELPGNLLSRLLAAVPRHLRRGLRSQSSVPSLSSPRVERALQLLARLERALPAPLVLLIPGLQGCERGELEELVELVQLVEHRGLDLRILAGWEQDGSRSADHFGEIWPELPRFVLGPSRLGAAWHIRSMAGGRALPPSVVSWVLDQGGGWPGATARALERCVDSGQLRLGRTPEGTACWLEASGFADEPSPPELAPLEALMASAVEGVPWAASGGLPPGRHGISPAILRASEPELHPEPRVRAVLYAWRGHARTLAGDRDLQADADLFQAEEELEALSRDGWEPAASWLEYVSLVRTLHLAARGRQLEARRRLDELGPGPAGSWRAGQRRAAELLLATAEGVAVDAPGDLEQAATPEERAATGAWLLQRGRLGELLGAVGEAAIPSAWDADSAASLAATVARARCLRGEHSLVRTMLRSALGHEVATELGPARARLHLAMAELELELFCPGQARAELADCFVLLRNCDRPEIAAERERIRGRIALSCGEPGRAEAAFRTGLNKLRGTGFHVASAELRCWLARALARLGRRREAAQLVEGASAHLSASPPAMVVACAARWEVGGYGDDPLECFAPLASWIEAERVLLVKVDLVLARVRYAALHKELGLLDAMRREAGAHLGAFFGAQDQHGQGTLAMDPRMRHVSPRA